jgi:hypothetical protein
MANELIVKYGVVLNSGETFSGSSLVTKDYVDGLNSIISLTYSSLYNYVVNGQLIPGQWYRLTDYKSVNFLNGWSIANFVPGITGSNFEPREIFVGETEVLLLQAATNFKISEIGFSETYLDDVIEYDPFVNKIGVEFDVYNGVTLPNSVVVSGFDLQWDGSNVYFNMPTGYPILFGHFLYLYCTFNSGSYEQDGFFEPVTPGTSSTGVPSRINVSVDGYKVILTDLDFTDFSNYDTNSLYVDLVYAIGDSYGWVTRRKDTYKNINVPFDFRGRRYRRFEVDLATYSILTNYWGQGSNYLGQGTTGNFQDLPVFNSRIEFVFNIDWQGMGGPDMYYYRGFSDNCVFLNNFKDVKISGNFFDNTLRDCQKSLINSTNFIYNTIVTFQNNNIFSNLFFASNKFYNLTNTSMVNSQFNNNIGAYFGKNNIKADFSSVDFRSSIHVNSNYDCEIFTTEGNVTRLSYVDSSDTFQIVSATA